MFIQMNIDGVSTKDAHFASLGSSDEEPTNIIVVETLINSICLLLPFDVNASVAEIAERAYYEYKKLNPRAPPMKVLCVRDAR